MRIWLALMIVVGACGASEAGGMLCAKYRKVNVREAPRMQSRVLRRDRQYTPYEVIGTHGDWVNIMTLDGKTGWIHGTVLMDSPAAVVSVDSAVLRWDAVDSAHPLRTLVKRHPLRVIGRLGGWLHVNDGRGRGWIRTDQVWGSFGFGPASVDPLL